MVYLIGAGPGDPELLTLKAARILSQAQVVVYDGLVNSEILNWLPQDCLKISVGVSRSRGHLNQEQINRLIIKQAQKGKQVVRLKCGDPLIFGRGAEEALALVKAGIPFQIVPGLTAGTALATSVGIPLTHRALASSIAFVTGHHSPGSAAKNRLIELSRSADTLVIYMGITKIGEIMKILSSVPENRTKPVAIIEKGTWPDQQIYISRVIDLHLQSSSVSFRTPGLIVVGQVVSFFEQFQNHLNQEWESETEFTTEGMLL